MDFANYWFSSAAGGGGYEIDNSLRFRGSQYLRLPAPGTGSPSDTHTFSWWYKKPWQENANPGVVMWNRGGSNFPQTAYYIDGVGRWTYASLPAYFSNKGSLRDMSAWYHFMITRSGSTVKMYQNGIELTPLNTSPYPSVNPNAAFGNYQVYIGCLTDSGGTPNAFFQGYMAEVHAINGQALTPTTFGEFDDNGVWVPIDVTGLTYGTNGFYLDFSDPNNLGADRSGNGNNFTATGFDTSGSTGSSSSDIVIDSPTNNFAVLNPGMKRQDRVLEDCVKEAGLRFKKGDGNNQYIASSIACPGSGKWYFEFSVQVHQLYVGVAEQGTWTNLAGIASNSVLLQMDSSSNYYIRNYYTSSTQNLTGEASNGQVYSMRYDADNGTVAFYNASGTQFGSTVTGLTTGVERFFFISGQSGADSYCNFGQQDWAHTLPTGYQALCTANLPAPDIADGSDYFNTLTYTGNGTGSFTGVGFQPDFTWIKCRNAAESHDLFDAVRGAPAYLQSNTLAAEQSYAGYALTSFDSDGFTLNDPGGGGYHVNKTGNTYVAWNWLADGSGSSNSDGSITSTVSANTTAGFSIVSYAGNNSASADVGHGLGVSPDLVIVKDRSTSNYVWMVKFAILGGNILELPGTGPANSPSSYSTGTIGALNSSTFGFTTNSSLQAVNGTGQNYIAYCFAEVEGYSKFGKYRGNGPGTGTYFDGPFIYTGFKPRYFLYKTSSNNAQWQVVDSARGGDNGTANAVSYYLVPNAADGEVPAASGNYGIDFVSNGIKIRTGNVYVNNSGWDFVYAAFAENPFGGDGVSPATAR